jgi:hypothetical protein
MISLSPLVLALAIVCGVGFSAVYTYGWVREFGFEPHDLLLFVAAGGGGFMVVMWISLLIAMLRA